MSQTVLPFKLEITQEQVTSHGGLALFGEFLHAMRVLEQIDNALPKPGSGAGYQPSRFVEPLVLMLHGGGRALEDLRQIREDRGLRELLGLLEMPSADATGDWRRRMGVRSGLAGLAEVNRLQVRRALTRDDTEEYPLDIDATQIVAEKREAKRSYQGERGYRPILGHLAEKGLVVGDEFREGNQAPAARNVAFIQYCSAQLPRGKRIAHLRSDSAAYQAGIFDWCEAHHVTFASGADLDRAVQALIAAIPPEEWCPYEDGEIAETVHCMNGTRKAFRLIVIRRPVQPDLFAPKSPSYRYTVIASNREETAEGTVQWYNRRGETSENRIKELKIGFGMGRRCRAGLKQPTLSSSGSASWRTTCLCC